MLDIQRLVEIGNWVEHDLQKRVSIRLFYSWPIIFHSLNRLVNLGSDSCGIIHILGILANGSLAMCGIGMEIPELTYGVLGTGPGGGYLARQPVLKDIRRDLPENWRGCAVSACLSGSAWVPAWRIIIIKPHG